MVSLWSASTVPKPAKAWDDYRLPPTSSPTPFVHDTELYPVIGAEALGIKTLAPMWALTPSFNLSTDGWQHSV